MGGQVYTEDDVNQRLGAILGVEDTDRGPWELNLENLV